MSHPSSNDPSIQSVAQKIGWFTASCVLVSNIIGGGIFTTTGTMARDLGDSMLILLLWFVGTLFALGGAMVYGELDAALPHAGGDYVYLREAYGTLIAFLSGWTSFTIGFGAAVAASTISFSSYALRVVAIGGLILGGLSAMAGYGDALLAGPSAQRPTLGAAAIALVIVIYCYLGWNVAGYIANDIGDPQRTLPRIIVWGTAFVAVIYLLLTSFICQRCRSRTGPRTDHTGRREGCRSVVGAAERAIGRRHPLSLHCRSGERHDVGRTPCVLGHGARRLARLHPRTAVPVRAIVFQSLWASLLILSGTFEQLLVYRASFSPCLWP